MENSKENLRELLSRFMDATAADKTAQDIENGDELLNACPAPQPREEVLAQIKTRVAITLRRRQMVSIQRRILAVTGVAAVLVVGIILSLRFINNGQTGDESRQYASATTDKFWEGADITTEDADIAVLSAEIETVKNALAGIQINDNGGNGDMAVNDLEMELIEISGDIWKG
jgi:hypothetical protein